MGLPLLRGTIEGADCASCPFSTDGKPTKPIVSEYPEEPKWALIADGPTRTEVQVGRPMIGQGGQLVNKALGKIGCDRNTMFVGYATLCQPPFGFPEDDRDRAADACRPRLQAELAQFPGIPVLTLGAVAARAVIPKAALEAIDPPDVPRSAKRSQKDKQKAEAKLITKALTRAARGTLALANKRLKVMVKYRVDQLVAEGRQQRRKIKRADAERLITDREYAAMKEKSRKDAAIEWKSLEHERELARLHELANPKPKKVKPKKIKITDIMGTCFRVDVDGTGIRPVIPSIHPAALLRGGGATIGGTHTPDLAFVNLIWDAVKAHNLAQGKNIYLDLNIETEIASSERTVARLLEVVHEAIAEGKVAIDLETYVDDIDRHHALMAYMAQVRAIGFATSKRAVSILWDLIPPWAFSYLQLLLAHPSVKKIFHNGLYDRTVLAARGFVLAGPWGDTLLMHHAAFPGNSHKLQVVTGQFRAIEPWKCLRSDVAVLLPDRSTVSIAEFISRKLPTVLSYEDGKIVEKEVIGWHKVHVPGQEWVSIKTERCDKKYTRGLIVTPDHRVMTQRGLVEARELAPGVDRLAVDEARFSEDQVAAIVGTLLGDSSLVVSRVFHKRPWDATRASISGGHTNEGLRDCKVAALPLGTSGCRAPAQTRRVIAGPRKGTTINAAPFYNYGTKWAFQYMDIAKLVYDEGWRRRIKPEALKIIGRRGLAMMFMDDGDLRRAGNFVGAGFATNGFPQQDVELFAQWLREQYGPVSIYTSAGPYCQLSAEATRNMLEDLRGYIHPSSQYKTTYNDAYREVRAESGLHHVEILAVTPVSRPITSTKHAANQQRALFDNRFCLSVKDTKLFFTNYGLVSNSEFRNAEETPESLTKYNAKDTGATLAIENPLAVWVKKTNTEKVYNLDIKMSEIASRMHLDGMPVSREVNSELLASFTKVVKASRAAVEAVATDAKLHDQIQHFLAIQQAGTKRKKDPESYDDRYYLRKQVLANDTDWKWKINSGKHVAALLQALGVQLKQVTASNQLSTKKDILEGLVDVPVIRDLLGFREADKLNSTFLWQIFDRFDKDGSCIQHGFADDNDRIHPIWSIHKISGRWGSSGPAVSNVPKDKWKGVLLAAVPELAWLLDKSEKFWAATDDDGYLWRKDTENRVSKRTRPNLRSQIVAPPGRIFVGFDFAQLEARIIALVSGDPFLCQVFADGKDIHRECARVIFSNFDELPEKEQKKAREETKPLEYGAFYGGAPETLWKQLLKEGRNVKLADVAKSIQTLMNQMRGVVKWQREVVARALDPRSGHEIRDIILGRRRTFPMGQVEATEAMNAEIQFTAAAIMNLGMDRMCNDRLPRYKQAFPIAQIHDAAVFECWLDDAPLIAADCKTAFNQTHEYAGRSVFFSTDVKISTTWAGV